MTTEEQMMTLGSQKFMAPDFSDFSRDLINECWNLDLNDRPSFSDILIKMENGEYKLCELNSSELDEVKNVVKLHKEKIPKYCMNHKNQNKLTSPTDKKNDSFK